MDILINNLKKRYGKSLILDISSMNLPSSQINAIVGPNGCGKSTLLNIIAGLDREVEGNIFYGKNKESIKKVAKDITLVMQKPQIFKDTVFNNAAIGLKFRGIKGKELEEGAMRALELVGLKEYSHRKATTLSGGEAQRLAFARAIAFEPKVVLLDEPTSNIDSENKEVIGYIISRMKSRGLNIVLVSHDAKEIQSLADNIYQLNKPK